MNYAFLVLDFILCTEMRALMRGTQSIETGEERIKLKSSLDHSGIVGKYQNLALGLSQPDVPTG